MKKLIGTSSLLLQKVSEKSQIPILKHLHSKFADGECRIEIHEDIEDQHIFVIQSTCPPVNQHSMELFILLDALKRAHAKKITLLLTYMGYSRQDRKLMPHSPLSASLIAQFCSIAGASEVILINPHSEIIPDFFDIPVQSLSALNILAQEWKKKHPLLKAVCVSPDAGGLKRTEEFAKAIGGSKTAWIQKERSRPNQAQALKLTGEVQDQNVILVDDMIDTAGTLCTAADNLVKNGAKDIFVVAVHGIFSPPAVERIKKSPLQEIWVTNSTTLSKQAQELRKIKQIDLSSWIAQEIKNRN